MSLFIKKVKRTHVNANLPRPELKVIKPLTSELLFNRPAGVMGLHVLQVMHEMLANHHVDVLARFGAELFAVVARVNNVALCTHHKNING
jgi:hypothetical protein